MHGMFLIETQIRTQYCLGDKMNECKRKEYSKEHGHAPSDDMMPTGHKIFL